MATLENANPLVYGRTQDRLITPEEEDDDVVDEIDSREVFDILSYLLSEVFVGICLVSRG